MRADPRAVLLGRDACPGRDDCCAGAAAAEGGQCAKCHSRRRRGAPPHIHVQKARKDRRGKRWARLKRWSLGTIIANNGAVVLKYRSTRGGYGKYRLTPADLERLQMLQPGLVTRAGLGLSNTAATHAIGNACPVPPVRRIVRGVLEEEDRPRKRHKAYDASSDLAIKLPPRVPRKHKMRVETMRRSERLMKALKTCKIPLRSIQEEDGRMPKGGAQNEKIRDMLRHWEVQHQYKVTKWRLPEAGYKMQGGTLMAAPLAGRFPTGAAYTDVCKYLGVPDYLDVAGMKTEGLRKLLPAGKRRGSRRELERRVLEMFRQEDNAVHGNV